MLCGLGFSCLLSSAILAIPSMQKDSLPASLGSKLCGFDLFKHNSGWDELPHALTAAGYNAQAYFLFGDKYQTASLLSFYSPGQKRAFFLNILGSRKNQFSYWPDMADTQKGHDGMFVYIENLSDLKRKGKSLSEGIEYYIEALNPYFKGVQLKGVYPLFQCGGQAKKVAVIFICTHYNGRTPPEPHLY